MILSCCHQWSHKSYLIKDDCDSLDDYDFPALPHQIVMVIYGSGFGTCTGGLQYMLKAIINTAIPDSMQLLSFP
jgi:hypothetical protein